MMLMIIVVIMQLVMMIAVNITILYNMNGNTYM